MVLLDLMNVIWKCFHLLSFLFKIVIFNYLLIALNLPEFSIKILGKISNEFAYLLKEY